MNENAFSEKKQKCEKKIFDAFRLDNLPVISCEYRQIHSYQDEEAPCCFETRGRIRVNPAGYYNSFSDFTGVLYDEYINISKVLDPEKDIEVHLIKLNVRQKQNCCTCGWLWLVTGYMANHMPAYLPVYLNGAPPVNRHFCVVLYRLVDPVFRNFGTATLLKLKEMEFALKKQCGFIQTYHDADNPHFNSAVIPSLKNGYVFYHGDDPVDEYEQQGFIHLRKFLDPDETRDVRVFFKDGAVFKSPSQNNRIIAHLCGCTALPGKEILKIESYPKKPENPKNLKNPEKETF